MTQPPSYSIEALFRGLKNLLNSLPTEEEKRELLRNLKEAQDFLEELRALVDAIPTMESSHELSAGLSRLDVLTARAYHDAGLRKLLGLRGLTSGRIRRPAAREDENGRAGELKAAVAQSETSDIADLLSREPLAVLKELAGSFGIRTPSRERKPDLIRRIETHVENQRGYALLRGDRT